MKKLKLNFKNTQQVLTREQLKHIVGGSGTGGSDSDEEQNAKCTCSDGREAYLYCPDCSSDEKEELCRRHCNS